MHPLCTRYTVTLYYYFVQEQYWAIVGSSTIKVPARRFPARKVLDTDLRLLSDGGDDASEPLLTHDLVVVRVLLRDLQ